MPAFHQHPHALVDQEFLHESLDPQQLTIQKLKQALSQAMVTLPPRAERKPAYVHLFQEEISAYRAQWLKRLRGVQPSAKGIMAVSERGSPLNAETLALSQRRHATSPAVERRVPVQSQEQELNPFQRRRSLARLPEVGSDTKSNLEGEAGTGKSQVKKGRGRSPATVRRSRSRRASSSSSSSSSVAADAGLNLNKSPDADSTLNSTKSRRVSKSPAAKTTKSPSSKEYKPAPLPFHIAGYVHPQDVLNAKGGQQLQEKPVNKTKQNHALKVKQLLHVLKWVFIGIGGIFGALIAHHLHEYRTLDYCPKKNNTHSKEHQQQEVVQYAFGVPYPLPKCRPCPPHAMCHQNKIINCFPGFLHQSRTFPFHDSCVPDVAKYAKAEQILEELSGMLSEHAGLVECGEKLGVSYLKETEVKLLLKKHNPDWSSVGNFDVYWSLAVEELETKRSDRPITIRTRGTERTFYSTAPHHPFFCRITKALYSLLAVYRVPFMLFLLLSSCLYWAINTYKKAQLHKERIRQWTEAVLSVLVEQEERFRRGEEERSAVSVSQLRDFFLADVKSLMDRERLWKDVRKELLCNSSVRETVTLVEGEQHDAWQWVGSSSLLSPDRQRSRPRQSPMRAVGGRETGETTSMHLRI